METNIIKWVIGNDPEYKNKYFKTEDQLLEFIKIHKLEILLYNKIKGTKCKAFSDNFISLLQQEVILIKKRILRNVNILKKIYAERDKEFPAIPIKGVSAYLLLNDENHIKNSEDIDILAKNPQEFETYLSKCGYEKYKGSKDVHELSSMISNDIEFDIHKYFPSISLPNEIRRGKIEYLNVNQIDYSVLNRNKEVIECQGEKIVVPDIEMTIVIAAAHIFKGYTWTPNKMPCFPFAEINEVYALAHHHKYNPQKLIALIQETNTKDALSFVSSIIDAYYQDNPLKDIVACFKPIFKVSNDICGPWELSKQDNFFENLPFRNINDVVDDLGANNIHYGNIIHTSKLPNIYRYGEFDFDFKFQLSADFSLSFDINDENKLDNVLLANTKFDGHFRFNGNPEKAQFFYRVTKADYEIITQEYGYNVTINYNYQFLEKSKKVLIIAESIKDTVKSQMVIPLIISHV